MRDNAHVLAIKILAFSMRLGQLVPRDLSRMKPVRNFQLWSRFSPREILATNPRQDTNLSAFHRLF